MIDDGLLIRWVGKVVVEVDCAELWEVIVADFDHVHTRTVFFP